MYIYQFKNISKDTTDSSILSRDYTLNHYAMFFYPGEMVPTGNNCQYSVQ